MKMVAIAAIPLAFGITLHEEMTLEEFADLDTKSSRSMRPRLAVNPMQPAQPHAASIRQPQVTI
jgi:hypothetical protein